MTSLGMQPKGSRAFRDSGARAATLILILPALCLMNAAMLAYSFFGGFWRQELAVYQYFLAPKNWDKMCQTRKAIQKKRRASDKEIVKRFTGKISFQDVQNPLLKYIANPLFNLYWLVVRNLIQW